MNEYVEIEYPEDCPHLDKDECCCKLDKTITCSPYFGHFPTRCKLEIVDLDECI